MNSEEQFRILVITEWRVEFEFLEREISLITNNVAFSRRTHDLELFNFLDGRLAPAVLRPNLILIDLGSEKQGLESLQGVKQSEFLCDVPTVILSHFSGYEHSFDCYQMGADAVIERDFDAGNYQRRISQMIDYYSHYAVQNKCVV